MGLLRRIMRRVNFYRTKRMPLQVLDCQVIYFLWHGNGCTYGPYDVEAMKRFDAVGKLHHPSRIQIIECTRKSSVGLLEWFGSVEDLRKLFGRDDCFPKRLSQFIGKWTLPEIIPNPALYRYEPINFRTFNLSSFLSNLSTSTRCPFVTGTRDPSVTDDQILPLSSIVDVARRILIEYGNLDPDERQLLHILLSEYFSPAVIKYQRIFTIDFDYLKIRHLLDDVKRYTFERKLGRQLAKIAANQHQQSSPSSASSSRQLGWMQAPSYYQGIELQ
ncbi:Protein CBG15474 [Caenorhabditis briggsae]|uniref:Protein CBG15474 n=1 Tax=Caenorhabditis briggsae TaxID=6238 RepID=A8XM80_CAEBR|nr:Protein CBG15474 [Caenorhabditis briggsae]CAP33755.2 Protein CBG15474 [Caenorhabditis briggsae]